MANAVNTTLLNFSGGEISPLMAARSDLPVFPKGMSWCQNFTIQPQGAADYRQGTLLQSILAGNTPGVIIPWQFSALDAVVIAATNLKFRFFRNNAPIVGTSIGISSITQTVPTTAPVFVTSTAHGLATGQSVYISGASGMSNINNRIYTVTVISTTSFSVVDEFGNVPNFTVFSAYTGNGMMAAIYEVTTPYATADLPQLKYAQVGDLMYIVNQNYAPMKLTRFAFTNWTLATFTRTNDPFSSGNWPATVAFSSDGRLVYANSGQSPEGVFGSETPSGTSSAFDNFTVGTLATNAYIYNFTPVDGIIDNIQSIKQFGSEFALLGASSIRLTYGATQELPPTGLSINTETTIQGSSAANPIVINWDLIFIDVNQKRLRGMQYNLEFSDYEAIDYNLTSEHLGEESQFTKIVWTKGIPDIVWVLRADGSLLSFTFNNVESVSGFARVYIGGGAQVLDIGTIRNSNGSDQLWMTVSRTINGAKVYSIEVLADRPVFPLRRAFFTNSSNQQVDQLNYSNAAWEVQKNANYLDMALEYDGRARGIAAAATITASGTAVNANIVVTASAPVFTVADVGSQIWINSVLGSGRATIMSFTDSQHVSCTILEQFPAITATGVVPGLWDFAVKQITNAGLFEGQTMQVAIDGGGHPSVTVLNSVATFQWFGVRIFIGQSYVGLIATMNIDAGGTKGPANSKPRNIKRVRARFKDTVGCYIGTSEYNVRPVVLRTANQISERIQPPFSGVVDMDLGDNWSNDTKQVVLLQIDPVPCTILGLDCEVHTNEPP